MKTFVAWLENWDDAPEINGEYWITEDGGTLYADGDIGDMNHEGYVIDHMQRMIADRLDVQVDDYVDWDEVKKSAAEGIYEEKRQEAEEQGNQKEVEELDFAWEDEDYDSFLHEALSRAKISDEEFQIANGQGDPREYAMEHWGWKRVDDHNIETWTLNQNDIYAISQGMSEIANHIQDEEEAEQLELYIYVYSNKKSYDLTLAELDRMAGQRPTISPQPQHQAQQQPQQPAQVQRQQPEPPQDPIQRIKQLARDRFHGSMDKEIGASNNHQKDQDLQLMHPYYRNKKFPFADWVFRKHGQLL
jgi:hypothetical protein